MEQKRKKDIKTLLAPYIAKWPWFVASVICFGLLGAVYCKKRQNVYEVNANVVINPETTPSIAAMGDLGELFGGNGDVDDEIFVISSHTVYREVAKKLGLNQLHTVKTGFLSRVMAYPEFPIALVTPAGISDTLTTSMLFDIKVNEEGLANVKVKARKKTIAKVKNQPLPLTIETSYGTFTIEPTDKYEAGEDLKTSIKLMSYNSVAEALAKQIKSDIANRRSHVIQMSMKSPNTIYACDVLNNIIDEYNLRGMAENSLQNQKTAEFVEGRLASLLDSLKVIDNKIQSFKDRIGVFNIEWSAEYNFKIKSENDLALAKVQTESEILRMTRDFIADPKNAYDLIPTAIDNEGIQKAVSEYNKLILQRINMLSNAREGNVALRQLTDQIDALRGSIISSVDKAYNNSMVTINDLKQQIKRADAGLGDMPKQEKDFMEIYRGRAIMQTLYGYLLQKKEETGMALANALPKAQIIDEAYTLSDPVGLGKISVMLAFLLLGLAFPYGIIYIKDKLRSKFESRQEIEELTDVPVLGEVSITRSGKSLVVGPGTNSSLAELFRLMRANLQFVLNNTNDKVVLVTSTSSGEGKSFISVNLAASLALLGRRVLLVGMDIRKPMLGTYLDLPEHTGLTEYLSSHEISINDIIIRSPRIDGMDVIVAGPIPPNPAELLASNLVDDLFHTLRAKYDYIIVDTAPVGMVADTFTLNRIADAAIYVTRLNVTDIKDIDFINNIYEEKRLKKLSLVINGVKTHKGYGYGYGHHSSESKDA